MQSDSGTRIPLPRSTGSGRFVDGCRGSSAPARWLRALVAAALLLAGSAGAAAATCGDGVLSPELGEQCDGGACCDALTCTLQVALCEDSNPCTFHTCSMPSGVRAVCGFIVAADGTSCNDADYCNGVDTCRGGICQHSGNPCPDDGVFCNGIESCLPTRGCTIAPPCPGADGGPNCADSCDEATNSCTAPDPAGSACGDQGRACLVVDTCDGAGICVDNGFETAGTACGDPSVGECNGADTCDSAGRCQDNHADAGTSCGDQQVDCMVDDACDGAGICIDNGFALAETPCGDASASACDDPDTCDGAGLCQSNTEPPETCPVTEALLSYRIQVPKRDLAGVAIAHNALPKEWVITVNDVLLDDTEPDDPENVLVARPLGLDSPAALNGAPGPIAPQRHYLRYALRRGRQSVQPADDASGRLARPPRHVGRTWMLRNELGAITLSSIEVTRLLLPAAADANAVPPAPVDATHYACYRVRVRDGEYSDQTPGRCARRAPRNARVACLDDADCGGAAGQHDLCAAPRFRRDLQVFVREPFFDDCARLADGVTPSFAGTAVEGNCLFDLRQPVELCNPIATSAVQAPRESAADFDPSLPSGTQSLLCYRAGLARTIEDVRAAGLAESTVGTLIAPSQSRYEHRELAAGTAVYTTPGSRYPAPTLVETELFRNHHGPLVCLPTDVSGIAGQ